MKKMYLFTAITLLAQFTFGAELFVRVLRSGSLVAIAYNQTQYNNSNTYHFFELPGGNVSLQIRDQQTGNTLYNGYITMAPNQQVIGEIDYYGNFRVIQTNQLTNDNWYGNTSGTGYAPPVNTNPGYYPPTYPAPPVCNIPQTNVANNQNFTKFLNILDNESFDSNKLNFAKSYINKNRLSAQQVADVSSHFSFDSIRLEWAKHAYKNCYDPANYFLLKSSFSFSSNYSALEDYIEGL